MHEHMLHCILQCETKAHCILQRSKSQMALHFEMFQSFEHFCLCYFNVHFEQLINIQHNGMIIA